MKLSRTQPGSSSGLGSVSDADADSVRGATCAALLNKFELH